MVYCEQDMCESKLGRLMQAFRTDRPSEWQMDEFIGMAEDVHKMNKELLAALEELLSDMRLRAKLDGDVDSDGCAVLNCGNGVLYAANQAIAKAKGTA